MKLIAILSIFYVYSSLNFPFLVWIDLRFLILEIQIMSQYEHCDIFHSHLNQY